MKRVRTRYGCRLGAAFLAASFFLTGQQFPQHTLDVDLDFSSNTSMSRWVNGFLPKFTRGFDGSQPAAWMVDRNGKTVIPKIEITFPEVSHLEIKSATADSSGRLYLALEIWSPSKAGTGAICRITPDGKPALLIRTDDFVPVSLAVIQTGEIWALGLPELLQTVKNTDIEYDTVQRISASGKFVASLLPRSGFGARIIPTEAFGNVGAPLMWATAARVGIYSAMANRWVEIDINTSATVLDIVVAPPTGDDGKPAAMSNIVMVESDGSVYAGFYDARPGTVHSVSGVYWLNKTARRWDPARPEGKSSEYQLLSGADGDNLIFRAGTRTFGWFTSEPLKPVEK